MLSLPWRGRPKVINNVFATFPMIIFLRPVLADIPYWISASFQVKPWLFLTCAFKLLILALLVPHTGQQNGFSPVCILMCMISFCFEMNFLLHWSHWCSHESCLREINITSHTIYNVRLKYVFCFTHLDFIHNIDAMQCI